MAVVLKAVVDDSGDERMFLVGGFISEAGNWDDFSSRWTEACRESQRISYYRTNNALGLKKDFAGWKDTDRDRKISRLASTIAHPGCYGIRSYLGQDDYRAMFDGHDIFDLFYKKYPYFMAAYFLVGKVCEAFAHCADKIDFVFDSQGKIGYPFKVIFFDLMLKRFFPCLGECFHLDDRTFPPLQAADMYAAWSRRTVSPAIQLWTASDSHLSQIPLGAEGPMSSKLIKQGKQYAIEHSADIRAFADAFAQLHRSRRSSSRGSKPGPSN